MSAEGAESRSTVGKVLWVALPLIVGALLTLFQGKAEQAGRMDNLENRIAAHESLSLSSVCRQVERLEGTGVQLAQARTALDAQVLALTERVQQVESRPASWGLEPETPASLAKLRSDLERIRASLALLGPLSERVAALEQAAGAAPPPAPETGLTQAVREQEAGLAQLRTRVEAMATREALEALSQRVAQLAQQVSQLRQAPMAAPGPGGPQPPAPAAPAAPAVAILQSQRKGGLKLDLVTLTADSRHVLAELLVTSDRSNMKVSVWAPGPTRTRAVTSSGETLADGAVSNPRNDYATTDFDLVAGVPTRFRLFLECVQPPPVRCAVLVVHVVPDGRGWLDDGLPFTFRDVVAVER